MVVIFYGTSAELIKMLGVVQNIPRSELLLICSSQHHNGLRKVHPQLGIEPDITLSNGWFGNDVVTMPQMAGMMLRAHGSFFKNFLSLRQRIKKHDQLHGTKSIGVVHGDTLTTVIGCYMSKMLGLKVAHVEAGLRTYNWRSPFPEELDRRAAAKFTRLHFPPSPKAEADLIKEKVKGELVNTKYNTAKDAIEQSWKYVSDNFKELNLPKSYTLVLLHRTELIENRKDFEKILKVLHDYASPKHQIVFTEHSTTSQKLRAYKFDHYLKKAGIKVIPKQPYFDFMEIVRQADAIVTDGGGLQEDAYFLGIPTIVHRKRTERQDGLGQNAELSGLDTTKVAAFLKHHKSKDETAQKLKKISPSKIVVDTFYKQNYFTRTKK